MAMVLVPLAHAQERPWSLRDLFKPRQQMQWPKPPPPAKAKPSRTRKAARDAAPRTSSPQARESQPRTAAPEIAEVTEKAENARIILVVGDFVAGAAAEGIDAIFAEDPTVRVVDRSNGASGLVRNDHFDWPQQISVIIGEVKPAAVVVALGANDRQPMSIGSIRQPLRSDSWMREYTARVISLLSEIHVADTPVIWLGAPPFRSARMNADILAFNEIFRKTAADAAVDYAEVWDGFVDDQGEFVGTGPDVNGQQVRLRTDDGINFTAAGKRKLAFYAEKPLRAILGTGAGPQVPQGDPSGQGPVVAAPNRTAPIALTDPALDGGDVLLGGSGQSIALPARSTPAQAYVAGRADDFLLPGAHPGSAMKTEEPDRATTSALRGPVMQP